MYYEMMETKSLCEILKTSSTLFVFEELLKIRKGKQPDEGIESKSRFKYALDSHPNFPDLFNTGSCVDIIYPSCQREQSSYFRIEKMVMMHSSCCLLQNRIPKVMS